jgi:hypothetical protein
MKKILKNYKGKESFADLNLGEGNSNSKLNLSAVREIRRALSKGTPGWEIAEIYKISQSAVSNIKSGRTWSTKK